MLKETEALKNLILAHEDSILKDINFFVINNDGGDFITNDLPNVENKLLHPCTCVTFIDQLPFIEIKIEGINETFYPEDVDIGIFASKSYYASLNEEEAKNWSCSIRMYTAEEIQSDLEKRIARLTKEFEDNITELQEELECVNGYMQSIEDELKSERMHAEIDREILNEDGAGI